MKRSRKKILVHEEEYLQLTGTQNEGEKPPEKSAKMDETTEKWSKMNQPDKEFVKMEQLRESQQK